MEKFVKNPVYFSNEAVRKYASRMLAMSQQHAMRATKGVMNWLAALVDGNELIKEDVEAFRLATHFDDASAYLRNYDLPLYGKNNISTTEAIDMLVWFLRGLHKCDDGRDGHVVNSEMYLGSYSGMDEVDLRLTERFLRLIQYAEKLPCIVYPRNDQFTLDSEVFALGDLVSQATHWSYEHRIMMELFALPGTLAATTLTNPVIEKFADTHMTIEYALQAILDNLSEGYRAGVYAFVKSLTKKFVAKRPQLTDLFASPEKDIIGLVGMFYYNALVDKFITLMMTSQQDLEGMLSSDNATVVEEQKAGTADAK